jgi:hypothetical protein
VNRSALLPCLADPVDPMSFVVRRNESSWNPARLTID